MPNIPSPISETSEDSYFPPPRPSKPAAAAAPNFSRVRPATTRLHRDAGEREYHIRAFYEPPPPCDDLPDEPRFSFDSTRTASTSDNSAASEFAWDGERGELRSRARPIKFDEQRVQLESPRRRGTGTSGGRSSTSSSAASRHQHRPSRELPTPASSSSGKSSHSRGNTGASIPKPASLDHHRPSARPSTDTHEDAGSHHTVSESGSSGGSFDLEGRWQSSEYDCSGLSEEEIQRLLKKGVNPALYAEMQAAKKRRSKWVGALSGNTFLS